MKKVALIGIGNIIFCDDGLGVYAVSYIERNYQPPSSLDIFDGGTFGFSLMPYFQEYDYVLLVSTTSVGKSSGCVSCFSLDEMMELGKERQTAHETELLMMLEICSFLDEDMAEVNIVSMKPDDILLVEANLTQVVKEAFPKLIEKIVQVLDDKDIKIRKKDKEVTLDTIIKEYANPTMDTHDYQNLLRK